MDTNCIALVILVNSRKENEFKLKFHAIFDYSTNSELEDRHPVPKVDAETNIICKSESNISRPEISAKELTLSPNRAPVFYDSAKGDKESIPLRSLILARHVVLMPRTGEEPWGTPAPGYGGERGNHGNHRVRDETGEPWRRGKTEATIPREAVFIVGDLLEVGVLPVLVVITECVP